VRGGRECLVAVVDATVTTVVVAVGSVRLDGLALAARCARLSGGSTHAVSSGGRGKRMGGLDAGYLAKALGVARSDLEHCADLQATLRPKKSTSGALSLSFIGSVFYASLISDVDYTPNGLQDSRRLDAGPLLREERTSTIRCLRSAFVQGFG
jgi:hypothetical protein